ncbi:MAG: glycosyltransferase family 4 protein [bacterium]
MKKVLITTGIFPPDIGGPATFIERLASDLSGAGFEITVLTYGAPEKKARPFKLASVSRRWPAGLRQMMFLIRTFFLARHADIIYTTDLYAPGYSSMLAAKFWRKKFIVRFAGDSAWEAAANRGLTGDDILVFQERTYGGYIEKRKNQRTKILKSANTVVAVSNFMRDLAIRIGVSSKKVRVIYNAVDFFGVLPERQMPDSPTLVFSGRLTPWKGVDMLVKIVTRLKTQYPDIIFDVLGSGSELGKLKKLVRELELEKNVRFHGKISEQETHKIFARSTIFVLNTNYEGLSHAILNAMQVGVPVITTPVGGNPELIEDEESGLLVPYNYERAWEKAIRQLLENEDLREKFIVAGKKMAEKFKWGDVIEKTAAIFKDLAGSNL